MRTTIILAMLLVFLPFTVLAEEPDQPSSGWMPILEDLWEVVREFLYLGEPDTMGPNVIPVGLEPDDIQAITANGVPEIVPVGLSATPAPSPDDVHPGHVPEALPQR